MKHIVRKPTQLILICLAAALLLIQTGCAKRDMADINKSMKAEETFTSWPLSEQYEYYYAGRELEPIAFLALHKDYTIESQFWTRIFPTVKMKEFWRNQFNIKLLSSSTEFKGFEITLSSGEHVGMVYSRYYWVTAWPLEPGSNQMVIPPPELSPIQPEKSKQWRSHEN